MDKLLINHTYEITVIHRISYLPFEQQGPDDFHKYVMSMGNFEVVMTYIRPTVNPCIKEQTLKNRQGSV